MFLYVYQRVYIYRVPFCSYTLVPSFLSQEGVGQRGTKSFCGSVAFLAPEILLRKGQALTGAETAEGIFIGFNQKFHVIFYGIWECKMRIYGTLWFFFQGYAIRCYGSLM